MRCADVIEVSRPPTVSTRPRWPSTWPVAPDARPRRAVGPVRSPLGGDPPRGALPRRLGDGLVAGHPGPRPRRDGRPSPRVRRPARPRPAPGVVARSPWSRWRRRPSSWPPPGSCGDRAPGPVPARDGRDGPCPGTRPPRVGGRGPRAPGAGVGPAPAPAKGAEIEIDWGSLVLIQSGPTGVIVVSQGYDEASGAARGPVDPSFSLLNALEAMAPNDAAGPATILARDRPGGPGRRGSISPLSPSGPRAGPGGPGTPRPSSYQVTLFAIHAVPGSNGIDPKLAAIAPSCASSCPITASSCWKCAARPSGRGSRSGAT